MLQARADQEVSGADGRVCMSTDAHSPCGCSSAAQSGSLHDLSCAGLLPAMNEVAGDDVGDDRQRRVKPAPARPVRSKKRKSVRLRATRDCFAMCACAGL